jgi:allantoicase
LDNILKKKTNDYLGRDSHARQTIALGKGGMIREITIDTCVVSTNIPRTTNCKAIVFSSDEAIE